MVQILKSVKMDYKYIQLKDTFNKNPKQNYPRLNFMSNKTLYALLSLIFFMTSCYSTRKTTYFRDLGNMTIDSKTEIEPPVIHKNDILSIKVSSLNPNASELFNSTNAPGGAGNSTNAGTNTQSFGYLVDVDGNIQIPILGNIKVEGLTTKALKDTLLKQIVARNLLIDPIVTVRFLNFRISVLGEVDHPSVYNVPSEKITLLEALALAGDLTVYSRRDNILIIREENGEKKLTRLDLSSSEIFYSPYYHLKSNDIVYVEHNKAKVASSKPIGPWLSALFSGTSLIIVIITNIK
jgi:polysaccharide export outer membrane protein